MKLHSKLTKYLVENHPLLFHSKFFQLMGVGIVMWLFSFLIGYALTTVSVLRNESVDSYYFESFFVLFHVITVIVVLSIWAIHFFKMKPVRNFYPLRKGYFTLLFFQLMLPFLLMVSVYIPFHEGVIAKTKLLLPLEEFRKDKRILNLGFPFLITNTADYSFENKAYPAPFPLEFYKIYDDQEEVNSFYQKNYDPSFAQQTYVTEAQIQQAAPLRGYLESNDSALQLNGTSYIFYKSRKVYTSSDSCDFNNLISEFVTIPRELTNRITESGLENFSTAFLVNYKSNTPGGFFSSYDYYDEYEFKNLDSLFIARDLPLIYEIAVKKDYETLEKRIEEFVQVAAKYGVPHHLDIPLLVSYWKEKQMKEFGVNVVKTYRLDNSYGNQYPIENEIYEYYSETEKRMLRKYLFVETDDFSKLNSNFQSAHFSDDYTEIYYVFLMMAFLLSSFVLWFEFMEIKPFLLSIPVGGVLTILIILLMIGLNSPEELSQDVNRGIVLFFLCSILGLAIYYVKSSTTNRFFASILLNLGYVLVHFILWYFFLVLNKATKRYILDESNHCGNTISHELFPWIEHPVCFLFFGMISVFLYYKLIPIWKSKKE